MNSPTTGLCLDGGPLIHKYYSQWGLDYKLLPIFHVFTAENRRFGSNKGDSTWNYLPKYSRVRL